MASKFGKRIGSFSTTTTLVSLFFGSLCWLYVSLVIAINDSSSHTLRLLCRSFKFPMTSKTYLVTLLLFCTPRAVAAIPLATIPEDTPPPILTLWLCIPFLVLATLRLIYQKYRRAQTIHECDPRTSVQASVKSSVMPSLRGIGFQLPDPNRKKYFWNKDFTGYLVGFLGSPTWETRIRRRVDRVVRKSKIVASTVTSPRISISEVYRSASDDTKTSRGTTQVSRTNTIASSNVHSQSRRSSHRSGSHRSRSASVSFLEMQTPRLPAHEPQSRNATRGQLTVDAARFSQATPRENKTMDDSKWRRRKLSMLYFSPSYFSPTVAGTESPSATSADAKRSLDRSVHSSSEESGSQARSYAKSMSSVIT